jgi:hypothetical protein
MTLFLIPWLVNCKTKYGDISREFQMLEMQRCGSQNRAATRTNAKVLNK